MLKKRIITLGLTTALSLKRHHASCSIGTGPVNKSGVKEPGTEARSSAIGELHEETHAYWGLD